MDRAGDYDEFQCGLELTLLPHHRGVWICELERYHAKPRIFKYLISNNTYNPGITLDSPGDTEKSDMNRSSDEHRVTFNHREFWQERYGRSCQPVIILTLPF